MLWIPGPTEVRPALLAECARPMIGHRSAAMSELVARIDAHLPHLFGLEQGSSARAAVAPSSATGMMEGALAAVEGRVLCVVNGAFSKRWFQIAQARGLDAIAMEVEWGRAVDDTELSHVLDQQGPFDAMTLVANETSTGVRTPIRPIANVLQAFPDTLLLVDVVSLIAGGAVDFDDNLVDFMLAGTQKALALPPGLAVYCVSEDWVERAEAVEHRGWYLDPLRHLTGHEAKKTPATPCIPLYYALAQQLEDISAGRTLPAAEQHLEGAAAWQARFDKHTRMQARTLAWAAERGLEPFPAEGLRSPTVSCISAGDIDVAALTAGLLERELQISNGYGPLKGQTFRIGHMGDHTEEELEQLLGAMNEVLGA